MRWLTRAALTTAVAVAAASLVPHAALAQGAPGDVVPNRAQGPPLEPPPTTARGDSLLDRFLGGLADSTDRYFGRVAAPLDTTGLDSSLAAGLARPYRGPQSRAHLSIWPVYAFNRVDGTLWGASLGLGNARAGWAVTGDLGYAGGSHRWLGGGRVALRSGRGDTFWRVQVDAGRRAAVMDRDHEERWLASLRALTSGSDRQDYLRRDGVSVAGLRSATRWGAEVAYHDWLESPLTVTTRWDLAHRALSAPSFSLRMGVWRLRLSSRGGSLRSGLRRRLARLRPASIRC